MGAAAYIRRGRCAHYLPRMYYITPRRTAKLAAAQRDINKPNRTPAFHGDTARCNEVTRRLCPLLLEKFNAMSKNKREVNVQDHSLSLQMSWICIISAEITISKIYSTVLKSFRQVHTLQASLFKTNVKNQKLLLDSFVEGRQVDLR